MVSDLLQNKWQVHDAQSGQRGKHSVHGCAHNLRRQCPRLPRITARNAALHRHGGTHSRLSLMYSLRFFRAAFKAATSTIAAGRARRLLCHECLYTGKPALRNQHTI